MNADHVTVESVIRELRQVFRDAQRTHGGISISIVAANREQASSMTVTQTGGPEYDRAVRPVMEREPSRLDVPVEVFEP